MSEQIDSTENIDESPEARQESFKQELTSLINKYSIENFSDTPDFMLADYVISCLNTFAIFAKSRSKWYE